MRLRCSCGRPSSLIWLRARPCISLMVSLLTGVTVRAWCLLKILTSSWWLPRARVLHCARCSSKAVAWTLLMLSIRMPVVRHWIKYWLSVSVSVQVICSRPHSSVRLHPIWPASAVLWWVLSRACCWHNTKCCARTDILLPRLSMKRWKNWLNPWCRCLPRTVWTGCMPTVLRRRSVAHWIGWGRSTMPSSRWCRSCTRA